MEEPTALAAAVSPAYYAAAEVDLPAAAVAAMRAAVGVLAELVEA